MPGAPFIYYGDEIGMRYVEGLKSVEGGRDLCGGDRSHWGEACGGCDRGDGASAGEL